jgi:hypothetical protein
MKHADALTLQARHCFPFVVIAVQRPYGRYMVDSRVLRTYGQNRGASDGDRTQTRSKSRLVASACTWCKLSSFCISS